MPVQKKGITTYKRDKYKVEISGEPENINNQIWFDLILSRLTYIITIIVVLYFVPKDGWPVLIEWLKKLVPLFFLAIPFSTILFLSG